MTHHPARTPLLMTIGFWVLLILTFTMCACAPSSVPAVQQGEIVRWLEIEEGQPRPYACNGSTCRPL